MTPRKPVENKGAEVQHGEEKIHGDPLEAAVSSAGEHDSGEPERGRSSGDRHSAIPEPENGGHARSQAAHLGHAHDHTKPAENLRSLTREEEFPREPPQQVSRAGKQHRRQ